MLKEVKIQKYIILDEPYYGKSGVYPLENQPYLQPNNQPFIQPNQPYVQPNRPYVQPINPHYIEQSNQAVIHFRS